MPSCSFSLPSRCPPLRISYLDQTLAHFSRIQALVPSFVFTYYYYLIRVSTINNAVQQYRLSQPDLCFHLGRTSTKVRAPISNPSTSRVNTLKGNILVIFLHSILFYILKVLQILLLCVFNPKLLFLRIKFSENVQSREGDGEKLQTQKRQRLFLFQF